jgi:predicted phage tail protein
MVNLKLGGILLVAGAALFLLSDTLFGDSNLAAYSIIAGLVLFPLGIVLALVGIIQVIIAKVKERKREE